MSRCASFILLFLSLTSCFTPRSIRPAYSRPIAEVGDIIIKEDILRTRMQLEITKYPEDFFKDYQGGPIKNHAVLSTMFKQIFDKIIEDSLILEYGRRRELLLKPNELTLKFDQYVSEYGQKSIDDFLTESGLPYNRWHQMIEDRLQTQNILDKELGALIKVGVSEVQSYYNNNLSGFSVDEQVRVRHIVTDSKSKADEILKRLQKGENFAKLAINHSISPDRAKGGDLGYFSRGSFPKIFDDTCFKLQKGNLSQVVKSDYGWHIFKLLDKKPPRNKTLTEVAGQIQQTLMQDKMARQYPKWIEKLRKEIPVKTNEEILNDFAL